MINLSTILTPRVTNWTDQRGSTHSFFSNVEGFGLAKRWLHSASEIDTFRSCQRKWGYRYIDHICPPPSKSAQLGSSVHTALETFLIGGKTDTKSPLWKIIEPGLKFLPHDLQKNQVEKHFAFVEGKLFFHGFIDFYQDVGQKTWLIGDHKTSSSFNHALSAKTLKSDLQANIYARWAFNNLSADKVKLRWIYYQTKNKNQSRCIEAELNHQENLDNCQPIFELAKEIESLIDAGRESSTLPKNTSSCFKYGRCPYFSTCKNDNRTVANSNAQYVPKENDSVMSSTQNNSSFHLYVDCLPIKSDPAYEKTIELSDLLKPIFHQIQTEKELKHYRLLGYGQHVGLIATYLSEHLKNTDYDKRTAILSSVKTPEGCDTLQTLISAAGQVTRGF